MPLKTKKQEHIATPAFSLYPELFNHTTLSMVRNPSTLSTVREKNLLIQIPHAIKLKLK